MLRQTMLKLSMGLWLLAAVGCASTKKESSDTAEDDVVATAATGVVTTVGRVIPLSTQDANHIRFAWPGVGIGATFRGTGVSAKLRDYANAYAGGPAAHNHFDVVLDGNAIKSFEVSLEEQTFMLAEGLPMGKHTVWLRKRTEASLGSTEFFGLIPAANTVMLVPPAHADRHIEVIGSSTETGYGADAAANSEGCQQDKTAQQNQDVAWPQLVADALHADLHNISYSGKGVISNIAPLYDPVNTMPKMYPLADPMDFDVSWNFSTWVADLVIFDMGGNDWEGRGGTAPDAQAFDAAFVAWVQQVIGYYPQAQIYITMNATTKSEERAGLIAAYQRVTATLNGMGHSQVRFLAFDQYNGTAYGCDLHPDKALHQAMRDQVLARLKADSAW